MTTETLPLRTLTDDELEALVMSDGSNADAIAEVDRREARARRAQAQRAAWLHRMTEWRTAAHAQYLEADAYCKGNLLSEAGRRAISDPMRLWSLPRADFERYASEELLEGYLYDRERLTYGAWRRGMAERNPEEYDTDTVPEQDTQPREGARDMGIGYMIARTAVNAAQNGQRQRSPGMTHEQYQQRTAAVRERLEQRRQTRAAATAVQGMVQEQAVRQAERAAHAQVAVPEQTAPVRRQREHIDGTTVLGYVRAWLAHYARWPSESALDAVTLWVAHACARDGDGLLLSEATPRLMFLSSEPGSGKSRALELVSLLCASRFGLLAEPTAAAVAHMLGAMKEPAFLDEADVLFGSGKRKEALRALLNSGYTRAGITLHMRGSKPVELKTFGAVALAGLDVLKSSTGGNLGPLLSRSIIVRMRKSDDRVPQLNAKTRAEGAMLHAALTAWAQQEREVIESAEVELPEWLTGRAAEIWAPLFVLAGTAAASHVPANEHDNGGDWPERVMMAAEDLALAPELAGEETDDLMAGLAGMAAGWGE